MANKVEKAKRFIREVSQDRRVIVNFSGGRDSTATLLLASDLVEPTACFCLSSIDLPGTLDFVVETSKRLGARLIVSHPDLYYGDFSAVVRRHGYFPNVSKRWCGCYLKWRPQRVLLKKLYPGEKVVKLVGIRRAESSFRKRRYRQRVEKDSEYPGLLAYPILDWTDDDVSRFLQANGLQDHKGYKVCGVSGCYWCPLYQPSLYLRIARAFRGIYRGVVELERELGKPSLTGYQFLEDLLRREGLLV